MWIVLSLLSPQATPDDFLPDPLFNEITTPKFGSDRDTKMSGNRYGYHLFFNFIVSSLLCSLVLKKILCYVSHASMPAWWCWYQVILFITFVLVLKICRSGLHQMFLMLRDLQISSGNTLLKMSRHQPMNPILMPNPSLLHQKQNLVEEWNFQWWLPCLTWCQLFLIFF